MREQQILRVQSRYQKDVGADFERRCGFEFGDAVLAKSSRTIIAASRNETADRATGKSAVSQDGGAFQTGLHAARHLPPYAIKPRGDIAERGTDSLPKALDRTFDPR